MTFISIVFILLTFYYLINRSHLNKSVDQKLLIYNNKVWILFDIIYFLHKILYFIWLIFLFFTQWWIFSAVLLVILLLNSISKWKFNGRFEVTFLIIKVIILILLTIVPFF
jgi:hypothetical protein